jgi:branched-chain amino acid transport system permease protein
MMYAVVGGLAHTLAGPIIGALIITFVPEYLRLAREWEPVITAAVIILIIIFMPMGVLGVVDRIRGAAAPARKWFVIRRRAKGEPRTSA